MSSSEEEACHLCECSEHVEEWEMKQTRIQEDAFDRNVDSLKILLDFSEWYKTRDKCNTSLSSSAIFQRSCDSHQVFNSEIRRIFRRVSLEVAELLVKKGFDANAQDGEGNTALHLSCKRYGRIHDKELKALLMLLWYGADPMIRNFKGFTAFDILLMEEAEYYHNYRYQTSLPLLQHLFYHTFDELAEWDIDAVVLLSAALLDSWIFDALMKTNIGKVVFRDDFPAPYLPFLGKNPTTMLFTMKPHCLQIIIEKFDYVVKELLHKSKSFAVSGNPILLIENFEILLNSSLKLEFTDWLRNIDTVGAVKSIVWYENEATVVQKFVCLLLSYGMDLHEEDLFALFDFFYHRHGCYDLFKIFLYMDVVQPEQDSRDGKRYERSDILALIVYNVTLDVPKMIQQRLFSLECLVELLPYFAVTSDFFTGSKWEKQVQKRPQVPFLVELARNVFRKYFIGRLGIMNCRQFYTLVKLLPISAYHRAIITYEAKLYPYCEDLV